MHGTASTDVRLAEYTAIREEIQNRSGLQQTLVGLNLHRDCCGRWRGAFTARARVRRRFAPHQLRHAHAVEMAREGVPLVVIQRQLGHADLGVTSVYLRGIDNTEIIDTVHERRAPMMPASAGLLIAR